MLKDRVNLGINCSTCYVGELCLVRNLDDADKTLVNSIIKKAQVLKKNEHLFHRQEKANYLYAIYTGCCKEYWLDENGNEHINNFYFPGDIIGFESMPKKEYSFSCMALSQSQICAVPFDSLMDILQESRMFLARFIHIMSYKMLNDRHIQMTTNAKKRIADFLLNILFRIQERNVTQQPDIIQMPMSQFDMSNYLGMAHETVSRVLHDFLEQGIINLTNREINIIDIEKLKMLGSKQDSVKQI